MSSAALTPKVDSSVYAAISAAINRLGGALLVRHAIESSWVANFRSL